MSIYWWIVIVVMVLGMIMPQTNGYRKRYIILMASMHIFISGCRYKFFFGDLIKYNSVYRALLSYGYFSETAIHGWKNTGFYWLMKFVGSITKGNFQAFLIILAIITGVIVAFFIYKYSPRPWLSYLVYNCMSFYITYNLCAIKQGLAMVILMISMMCIFEKKPLEFLIFTLLAGSIHMPALAFLPAYYIANRKIDLQLIVRYILIAVMIFTFRIQIVDFISEIYYEDGFDLVSTDLGGKVYVILLILLVGILLRGFQEEQFCQLFNIIVIAAIFQMFSGFSNVFTRLADYYLQFTVLFIPMIFYGTKNKSRVNHNPISMVFKFNERSMKLLVVIISIILIWWYHETCLGHTITNEVDNYLNYRFMWQV